MLRAEYGVMPLITDIFTDIMKWLANIAMDETGITGDGGRGSGNFNHEGRPGQIGGSGGGGGESGTKASGEKPKDSDGNSYDHYRSSNVSPREQHKVEHDINNVYHARFKGMTHGMITTSKSPPIISY